MALVSHKDAKKAHKDAKNFDSIAVHLHVSNTNFCLKKIQA